MTIEQDDRNGDTGRKSMSPDTQEELQYDNNNDDDVDDMDGPLDATITSASDTEIESNSARLDLLGVSVHWLCTGLLDEIHKEGFDETTACIHDLECLRGPPDGTIARRPGSKLLSPVDGKPGAAYVHSFSREHDDDYDDKVGWATHMLSYTWTYKLYDILTTLKEFCMDNHFNWKRTYIWIDVLCINQHRVVEAKELGQTGLLNFEQEFPKQLSQIGHMLVLFTPWKEPIYLQRIWCIFEMYTAHELPECEISVLIPSKEKLSLEQDLLGNQLNLDVLYDVLGKTKVQNALASYEEDRRLILKLIESGVGCTASNVKVNEFLRTWVRSVLNEIIEQRLLDNTSGTARAATTTTAASDEEKDIHSAHLMYKIGTFLRHNGEYEESFKWLCKCSVIYEAALGKDDIETAQCYLDTAQVLRDMSEYDNAYRQTKMALSVFEGKLGSNHIRTADCYHCLGRVLMNLGKYDDCLIQFRKSLQIRESELGLNHQTTMESYTFIGIALANKGDFTAALNAHKSTLPIYEAVHGVEHPQTANCYNDIGNALAHVGQYSAALHYYYKALRIRESVLGIENPITSDSYNNVGNMLLKKGDKDGALEQLHRVLSLRKAVLCPNHPKIASAHNNIANALSSKGQHEEALVEYRHALSIRKLAYSDTHACVANSYFNIGRVLLKLKEYDTAVKELRHALFIYISTMFW